MFKRSDKQVVVGEFQLLGVFNKLRIDFASNSVDGRINSRRNLDYDNSKFDNHPSNYLQKFEFSGIQPARIIELSK